MDDRFFAALRSLISIESVAGVDVSEAHPYGSGPALALEYALKLCDELGIRYVNRDGRVAWAEIGSGEEIVAILGHLDVVPVGSGWQHDPQGELTDGRLYGRGAADDKGPTLAALFAMKELQDSGAPLGRRVRLIFGQCEETGDWADMKYYLEHEEKPVFGFTPDADFPAIYGEKGILEYKISLPLEGSCLISVEGGEASNVVPDWARCTYLDAAGEQRTIVTSGKSAHASTPEKGDNAIDKLMAALVSAGVGSPLADFYAKRLMGDYHGGKLGCPLCDEESGRLTVNAGLLRTEGDTVTLTLDIRNPVTHTSAEVDAAIDAACREYGFTWKNTDNLPGVYMDRDGEVIRALVDVYRSVTGDMSEPTVIGGGTYARAMPGIVAYGPMRPGRECTEHQRDEYVLVEDLLGAKEIYRRAIERLANL